MGFPEELESIATSLKKEMNKELNKEELTQQFINSLENIF